MVLCFYYNGVKNKRHFDEGTNQKLIKFQLSQSKANADKVTCDGGK